MFPLYSHMVNFTCANNYYDAQICLFKQILSADGTQEVGKISKQWSGLAKEFFTKADNFGIQCRFFTTFP